MYVHTKLRKPDGFVVPKGPSFSHARTIACDIDGTRLSFKTPKHRPRYKNKKQILPAGKYNLDEINFRTYSDKPIINDIAWESFDLFYNAWAFYGPWFTGTLAELWMSFRLIKRVKEQEQDFSMFHPRAFESVITDYLTSEFSHHIENDGRHHYIAPVEWQPLTHLPVIAARLQVVPDETITYSTIDHIVFFPLTDQVMAYIHFIPSQIRAASQEENDKRVSRSTMYELMDNIIDSIQLNLSPEAQAQQKAALAGLDNTSLVKEFMPLKWGNAKSDSAFKKLEK